MLGKSPDVENEFKIALKGIYQNENERYHQTYGINEKNDAYTDKKRFCST